MQNTRPFKCHLDANFKSTNCRRKFVQPVESFGEQEKESARDEQERKDAYKKG